VQFFIDFVLNLRVGKKFQEKSLCLLRDIRILSILFLEATAFFTLSLIMTTCCAATAELLIVRHTEERFVCECVLNYSRTLDVVQQERLRYEVEQKSKYITASLSYLGQLHLRVVYAYLLKKEIGVVVLIFVKIYFLCYLYLVAKSLFYF